MIFKFLLIGVVILIGTFLFFNWQTLNKNQLVETKQKVVELVDRCGDLCEQKINEVVSRAFATISAQPKTTTSQSTPKPASSQSTPPPLVAKQSQIQYISVGGAGSTTSRDWADLLNTDFFLDVGEYGKTKEIRWSATLKIFQNGTAYARLFDVTHGVAIQGSEMNTTSDAFTLVESGQLTFYFSGKNRFRVQVKSLTGYEAFFDSGRIKIVTE